MKKVALLLANGFEEIEAITPIDLLKRAGIEVITIGIGACQIKGAHNIEIMTDTQEIPAQLDGVVIPGGMPGASNIAADQQALTLIKKLYQDNKLIAAICASPAVVLEKTEITRNKSVTCYPGFENQLRLAQFSNQAICIDGNIITANGPANAIPFALAIIEYLQGKAAAQTVAKQILLAQ